MNMFEVVGMNGVVVSGFELVIFVMGVFGLLMFVFLMLL